MVNNYFDATPKNFITLPKELLEDIKYFLSFLYYPYDDSPCELINKINKYV